MLYWLRVSFLFQSTLPRGSDFRLEKLAIPERNFNPRSLAGATITAYQLRQCKPFQSTLPRGSDAKITLVLIFTYVISIHAPLRERQFIIILRRSQLTFQSTLPCGSDIFPFSFFTSTIIFQSTLPCGSDRSSVR